MSHLYYEIDSWREWNTDFLTFTIYTYFECKNCKIRKKVNYSGVVYYLPNNEKYNSKKLSYEISSYEVPCEELIIKEIIE
jgi:hypothetical protein